MSSSHCGPGGGGPATTTHPHAAASAEPQSSVGCSAPARTTHDSMLRHSATQDNMLQHCAAQRRAEGVSEDAQMVGAGDGGKFRFG